MSTFDDVGPKFGEVVRFNKMTKRDFISDTTSTFVSFSNKKGRETFGLILGSIGQREPLPSDLEKRMNTLGWVSDKQLHKTLGKKKGEDLFLKITLPAKPKTKKK